MSGICGLAFFDGRPADTETVARMVHALAHRGPDASGTWSSGGIALGQCMLQTTPESLHERQPFELGPLAITADARIDNREELRALDAETDSELILRGYQAWGERCVDRLVGDFAFAIWDAAKRVLFAARDPMGVRPFYFARSPFAFASEIRALLCCSEVSPQVNEDRVRDFFSPDLEDEKHETFYRHIYRLPPAHSMTVHNGRVTLRRYWKPDPSRELRLKSDDEYAQAFRDVFSRAVRCRLRVVGKVGSMLSGGLDSSSIVCVARQEGLVHTFSATSESPSSCPESPFIEAVESGGGIVPRHVRSSEAGDYWSDLERVTIEQDEPFDARWLFMPRILYRLANDAGVKVVLDGLDGDDVASHETDYVAYLLRDGPWKSLLVEIAGQAKFWECSVSNVLVRHMLRPFVPEAILEVWRRLRGSSSPLGRYAKFSCRVPRLASTLREEHACRLQSGNMTFAMETFDRAAAMFSVEPRRPLFDRRVIEFCLALPREQKVFRGWTKTILRRAMVGILPESVRLRRDRANVAPLFIAPLLERAAPLLRDLVGRRLDRVAPFIHPRLIQEAFRRYRERNSFRDGLIVWDAYCLQSWLARIFKGGNLYAVQA